MSTRLFGGCSAFSVLTRSMCDDFQHEDIQVEEFVGDVHRTNLTNFKRQLQELLVVYSYQIPYNDFVKAYQQRFARILDLPSFGVVTTEALFEKVLIVFSHWSSFS